MSSKVEKSANRFERKEFLDVHGVRITPPVLEFRQAFEGKTYRQKLSIQNIGTSIVTVRILAPTSFTFKIKCVKHHLLSPGLSIVREVLYVFSRATSPSCILPIYVNENRYDYHLYATTSSAEVKVYPTYIDFGSIDMEYASPVQIMTLENVGTKPTKFYIDNSTTDDYSLIVEPMKGLLQADSKIQVNMRLIAYVEGPALIDVWVKADTPSNVVVVADVIKARFEPAVTTLEKSFTLVDFPVTYVGLSTTVSMYIRNFSASEALFCVMGEIDGKLRTLDYCKGQQKDYRYFDVSPMQGMFLPKQIKVIHFRFIPKKLESKETNRSFYFCIMHVCRIRSKFLTQKDYKELYGREVDTSTLSRCSWTASFIFERSSSEMTSSFLLSAVMPEAPEISKPVDECHCVKFYLHAIAEEPSVTVTPDELNINELSVGQKEMRVLQLTNNSTNLPIILVYRKVAFVDLDPSTVTLKPKESEQVAVQVFAKNIGVVNALIRFDLMFYDYTREGEAKMKVIGEVVLPLRFEVKAQVKHPTPELNMGITPKYLREAGKYCQEVKYNTPVERPRAAMVAQRFVSKSSAALMALPNETQQSLRPWRAKDSCKTIFTRSSRYVPPTDTDYEQTAHDKQVKTDTNDYYTAYLRRHAAQMKSATTPTKKLVSDYDLSSSKILCNDLKMITPAPIDPKPDASSALDYFPLLLYPIQIINVIVDPPVVLIGPVAPNNHCEFTLKIQNRNTNTISVYLRADKPSIVFPEGNRKLVDGNEELTVPAVYISQALGNYSIDLKVILNDCAFLIVNVLAQVSPMTLNLSSDTVVFSDDDLFRYLWLINHMDSDGYFRWVLPYKNFRIHPLEGYIKGKQSLCCYIEYVPSEEGPLIVDAELVCGDRNFQQMRLIVKNLNAKVYFSHPNLVFQDIPLNMPCVQMAILTNESTMPQAFALGDHELAEYIDVFPKEGVVYTNGSRIIFVIVKFTSCVTFRTSIKFNLTRMGTIELSVRGNVVYPDIVVQPRAMKFRTISCSTMETLNFTVENKSVAMATVNFDMSMYPEFRITETDKRFDNIAVDTIVLQKQGLKQLCIRFTPYASTRDTFTLPMIVNDILGPTPIDDHVSSKVVQFLTSDIPGCKLIETPGSLCPVDVYALATRAKLLVSKLLINLSYSASSGDSCPCYDLVFTNYQDQFDEICIRTDAINHPLYLEHSGGREIVQHEKSITCRLDPNDEVCFRVSFRPDRVGKYRAAIPIYLRSEMSKKPHTCINVEGLYPEPTITSLDAVIHFKPLPLKVVAVGKRKFLFENHFENCTIGCISPQKELELKVAAKVAVRRDAQEVTISSHFHSDKCQRAHLTVTVYCSCGGRCEVSYHLIAENCFLTNYALVHTYIMNTAYNLELRQHTSQVSEFSASLSSLLFEPKNYIVEYDLTQFLASYPLFPPEEDPLYAFMNTCVSTMEIWVYTQGFFGTTFYEIPNGIAHLCLKQKKKGDICIPPFIELLISMLGDQAKDYFQLRPIEENEDGARYLYDLYQKALDIITELGAHFTCIFPQYLMPYNYYRITISSSWLENETDHINETEDLFMFYNIAKQAWLDLLLQTYKVLVFPRLIRPMEQLHPKLEEETSPHKNYRKSVKNIVRNNHLFSTTELLLLDWLEFHYNQMRLNRWADNSFLDERKISHFGENMCDGFVYAAVMLTYCPYLDDHFKKLCHQPLSPAELVHNNILVVQSWNILNLSIGVTVADIVEPHPLKHLLAIAYLFEVLPMLYPTESLDFIAGLSQRCSKTLTLDNNNNFPVAYKPILYGDHDQCFKVKNSKYVIPPGKKCNIVVTYQGKFVKRSGCVMILSGECKGYRYATSKVVNLAGEPDVTHIVSETKIELDLYKVGELNLNITSPYNVATSYHLQYSSFQCLTVEDVEGLTYREKMPQFVVGNCVPTVSTLEFNEEGVGVLTVWSYPVSMATSANWIFFRNEDVGDFAIKIVTIIKGPGRHEVLQVPVPRSWRFEEINDTCSRGNPVVLLRIPCRNRVMWSGIVELMLKYVTEDVQFWKEVVHTTAGMHIFQRLLRFLSHPADFRYKICDSSEYEIVIGQNCNVVLPETVVILDKCSSDYIEVPMRMAVRKEPRNFTFMLKSRDGMEVRQYLVQFVNSSDDTF